MTRWDCSSTICPSQPGENLHCPACSHAAIHGEGEVNGRTYRWVFYPLFGPTFLCKNGQELKRSPKYRPAHPAWVAFEAWLEKRNLEEGSNAPDVQL